MDSSIVIPVLLMIVIAGVTGFLCLKIHATFAMRELVEDAIFEYRLEYIINNNVEPIIGYTDMESFEYTLFRFWDLSYKHILPKEKLAVIESYILRRINKCSKYC